MTFNVAADAYDRFMGRYSRGLSSAMADLAGVKAGQLALDVGCGPGALTGELVGRLGARSVVAVDPSASFVEAARSRNPGVRVELASAEQLPFEDGAFDVALAQLVVHFMSDPTAGLAEMARVTRSGGVVAACVWDHAGGQGPLGVFWRAVRQLDPDAPDASALPGAREGDLGRLFAQAGLDEVREVPIVSAVEHVTFEEWWEPFAGGVGPARAHVDGLNPGELKALRELCRSMLPPAPFVIRATAWACRGTVPPL